MKLSMRKTYTKNGEVRNNGYTCNIPRDMVFEAFGKENAESPIKVYREGRKIVVELVK